MTTTTKPEGRSRPVSSRPQISEQSNTLIYVGIGAAILASVTAIVVAIGGTSDDATSMDSRASLVAAMSKKIDDLEARQTESNASIAKLEAGLTTASVDRLKADSAILDAISDGEERIMGLLVKTMQYMSHLHEATKSIADSYETNSMDAKRMAAASLEEARNVYPDVTKP